jgi:hypothetical protein
LTKTKNLGDTMTDNPMPWSCCLYHESTGYAFETPFYFLWLNPAINTLQGYQKKFHFSHGTHCVQQFTHIKSKKEQHHHLILAWIPWLCMQRWNIGILWAAWSLVASKDGTNNNDPFTNNNDPDGTQLLSNACLIFASAFYFQCCAKANIGRIVLGHLGSL